MRRRSGASGKSVKARSRKTATPKRRNATKSAHRRSSSAANQETDATQLARERDEALEQLSEALEQQTATSEVLGVISSSPGDLQPVFATILENATRICAAKFGTLFLCEGNAFRVVAMHNAPTALAELRRRQPVLEARPGMAFVRSTMSKRAIQIADITEDQAYFERDPTRLAAAELGGYMRLSILLAVAGAIYEQ
jgi:hypothetical protein